MPLARSLIQSAAVAVLVAALSSCRSTSAVSQVANVVASGSPAANPRTDAIIRDSVRQILDRALRDSAFPGAIAVVGTKSRVIAQYAVGRLDWAASPPVDEHTIWDFASLTKVVGTTSGVMQLVGAGRIALDAPVQRYLPE